MPSREIPPQLKTLKPRLRIGASLLRIASDFSIYSENSSEIILNDDSSVADFKWGALEGI